MPDGCDSERGGQTAFPLCGLQTPASLQDIQRGLSQAWHLMLASKIDEALTALEAIERRLAGQSLPVATRYRALSYLIRSAVVAFQDDSLAVLAIAISEVFVEKGGGLGALSTETFEAASVPGSVNGSRRPDINSGPITAREHDVLSMIGQGHSNKRIARNLEISPETVKSHVKHIFSKLDVATRIEAVSRAVSLGLLPTHVRGIAPETRKSDLWRETFRNRRSQLYVPTSSRVARPFK